MTSVEPGVGPIEIAIATAIAIERQAWEDQTVIAD